MFAWMDYEAHKRKIYIQHKLNSGREHRVGPYLCDGYDAVNKTIYEYDGCWFHGHKCRLTHKAWQQFPRLMKKRLDHTEEKEKFLKAQGFHVIKKRECEHTNLSLIRYLPAYFQKHRHSLSEERVLCDVKNGSLFGMVEVDIEVPDHLYSHFEEMSPIFCTCDVPLQVMGPVMQEHIRAYNLSVKPRRLLVGGMKAERILLLTPLLRWYLEHGLVVSKVHQVIEFSPQNCFEQFKEQVSEARRKGDQSPDKLLIGDTMKLLGNSAYGSMIMDQEKHQKIEYAKGNRNIALKVNLPTFKKLEDLGEDFAEIELMKAKQKLNLPIQIGFAILQYAKLKMLEWY